jgi:hypothetical protein
VIDVPYLGELARILAPDGVVFLHHSNLGERAAALRRARKLEHTTSRYLALARCSTAWDSPTGTTRGRPRSRRKGSFSPRTHAACAASAKRSSTGVTTDRSHSTACRWSPDRGRAGVVRTSPSTTATSWPKHGRRELTRRCSRPASSTMSRGGRPERPPMSSQAQVQPKRWASFFPARSTPLATLAKPARAGGRQPAKAVWSR